MFAVVTEQRDRPERKVNPVLREPKVNRALPELKAQLALPELRAIPARQALRERRGPKARPALRGLKAPKVDLETTNLDLSAQPKTRAAAPGQPLQSDA